MLHGIDISNYQRGLRIADIQADFVIVKASEGVGYADPSAKDLAHQTLQSGRRLGMYHFAHPGKNTAQAEAEWFLKIVQPYIGKAILALDWEADTISDTAWAKEWLDIVYRKSGVRPWIYMSESVANRYDWTDVAKDYRLWMAQYRSTQPAYQYDMRKAGTPGAVRRWPSIICWQWSDNGRLKGWNGALDMDVFYGERSTWDEMAKEAPARKSEAQIADEVIAGKWGNGEERTRRLKAAGHDPDRIQKLVNEKLKPKSVDELAEEVIAGKWGNGETRTKRLTQAGHDAAAVQKRVNELLEERSRSYHTVRAGDTLSAIARRYGTSVAQLVSWNHIADPDRIRVGERLRVH